MKRKLLFFLTALCFGLVSGVKADVVVPTPVYFQNFEEASTTKGTGDTNHFGITGATLKGSGEIQTDDPLFGKFYQNMPGAIKKTQNANFLTLTTNAFSTMQAAGVQTVTISFWINAFNSTLSTDWSSIFVAYGENGNANHGYPYGFDTRNTLAVHTNVWKAYYHDNGTKNSSWLSKGASFANSWHHVALVYSSDKKNPSDIKLVINQYIDGTLSQSYSLGNGWDGQGKDDHRDFSLLDDMGRLTEYCIGGNSSEGWGDPDNQYAYDEIAIYNVALTDAQINQIKTNKLNRTATGTQIGNKACNAGYVTEGNMTNKITLKPGESYHYSFINYNNGGNNNWKNYVVPVYDTDDNRVVTVRADYWEDMHYSGGVWGSNAGCSAEGLNWTNWIGNMNGANVDMTVSFGKNKIFTMNARIINVDGSEWTYSYTNNYTGSTIDLTSNEYVKVALAVSSSWLDLLSEGYSAVAVTLGTNGYTTFASPNALDLTKANLPSGLKAYKAQSVNSTYVHFEEFDQTVPANTGILFEGTASETYIVPVVANGDAVSENAFEVNIGGATFSPAANTKYYALIKNSSPMAFGWFEPDNIAIPANKAYIPVVNGSNARLIISFDDEDPTAINAIEAANAKAEGLKDGKYLIGNKIVLVKNGVKYGANGQKLN